MQLSLPHLVGRFAILLISLEGIVCPVLNFVVENFGDVDIYSHVMGVGNNRTGTFMLMKGNPEGTVDNIESQQNVIHIRDILRPTLTIDPNDPKMLSFSVNGIPGTCYLKFRSKKQANLFIHGKVLRLTPYMSIKWVRIYSPERPVIVAYDELENGEMGFKLLDGTDLTNVDARVDRLTYHFMRSDLCNEIKIEEPHTLFLKNDKHKVDYKMEFKSKENMDTFLALLPDKIIDEFKTQAYFHLPRIRETDKSQSQDEGASSSQIESPSSTHDSWE